MQSSPAIRTSPFQRASFTCPLINAFTTASGVEYRLQPAYSFTGFRKTTDVQVLCKSADAGGCNDWYIDPDRA
jgi:hypothetical protein